MIRYDGLMNGQPFIGNKKTLELHNLDNEKDQCGIDDVLRMQVEKPFYTVERALHLGYRLCDKCFGSSGIKSEKNGQITGDCAA